MARSRVTIPLLSLLMGCVYQGVMADEFFQLGVSYGSENNVPRVLHKVSESRSGFVTLDLTGGESIQLSTNQTLTLAAQLSANHFVELHGFDYFDVGVTATYAYKFGLGGYAPRLGFVLSANSEQWDGEARDRRVVDAELFVEKRLSAAWFASAGLAYASGRGKSLDADPRLDAAGYSPMMSLPYDLADYDSTSAFAALDYEFQNGLLLSGAYSWIDGYTIATSRLPNPHVYKASKAVYIDPAWPDLWFAYRLKTKTDQWTLGVSLPVSRDASINLGAAWQDSDGPGDRDYDNRSLSIGFIQGF